MDFAGAVSLLVDRRDLDLQQEPRRAVAGRRKPLLDLALDLRPQAEEARLGRHELGADLLEPRRMGEVAGADDGETLPPRPERHMLQVRVPAGGAGVLGVDVKIGVEAHGTERRNAGDSITSPRLRPAVSTRNRAICLPEPF